MGIDSKDELIDNAARDLADRSGNLAFENVSTNELLNINNRIGDLYGQRAPEPQEEALVKWLDQAKEALRGSIASFLPVEFNIRHVDYAHVEGQPVIIPAAGILVQLYIESANEFAFITVPPRFVRLAINTCYGGAERDPNLDNPASFTPFEHSFVGDFSRALVKSALKTTSNEHALSTSLRATLVATDQEDVRLESTKGVEITWELHIADCVETFKTNIPASCISALTPETDSTSGAQNSQNDVEWSNQIRDRLNNTISKLQAVIRLGEVSLGEVSSLKPGNTIEIGKASDIELTIESEQQSLFSGKMGQKNGHYAVNIDKSLKK